MRPRRVGVLGSFHAGKTVLLTSLISQIKHGHLDVFGPDVVLAELNSTNSRFDPLETRSGLIPFDYDTAHDRLAHGGWPSKTVAASEYRSYIVRGDDRWRMYDLSLISPTTAERLAKTELIGPRQWTKLKGLISQREGQPTVVPQADKREALTMPSAFADLDA